MPPAGFVSDKAAVAESWLRLVWHNMQLKRRRRLWAALGHYLHLVKERGLAPDRPVHPGSDAVPAHVLAQEAT